MSEIKHHFSDGVYIKEQYLPAGGEVQTHSHVFDHLSILAKGRAVVTTDGVEKLEIGPKCLLIKKGVKHGIKAEENITWFCVWSSDETDPSRIDETFIERE